MDKAGFDSLSHYIDMLLDAICVVDENGHFLYVSAGGERIFGYKPEEMIGRQMLDMVHPEDRERTLQTVAEIMSGIAKIDFENRYIRKDGRVVHLLWSARWSENEGIRIAVARDISELKQTEARQAALINISEAAHTEQSLTDLYIRIHDIIAGLISTQQFVIGLCEQKSADSELVYHCGAGHLTDQKTVLETLCSQVARRGVSWPKSEWEQRALPDWLAVPLKSQDGIVGALMVKTDADNKADNVDECELLEFVSTQIAAAIVRRKMLESLHQLAMFDQLTGLPNRRLFHDRFQQVLARAKRNQESFAVLYLDLDKFKQANDHFGHEAGDRILRQTAQRLNTCLRDTDTVARMGGDEFVMILDRIDMKDVEDVVIKIRTELSQPYQLDDTMLSLTASIGIASFPEHGETQMSLMQQADSDMYRAKRAERISKKT